MQEISQFTSATPLAILAVALIISLLKPYAEASVLPLSSPLHDTTIRVAAVVCGAVLVLVATLLSGTVATGPTLFAALVEGGKAGLLAIASYHLLTGSLFTFTATSAQLPLGPVAAVPLLPAVPQIGPVAAPTVAAVPVAAVPAGAAPTLIPAPPPAPPPAPAPAAPAPVVATPPTEQGPG